MKDSLMPQDRVTIFRSFFDAAGDLSTDDERGKFYHAVCDYSLNGTEPKFTDPELKIAFRLIRPILDKSNSRREAGRCGGKQTVNKGEANRKQTASKSQPDIGVRSILTDNQKEGILTNTKEKPLVSSSKPKSSFKKWSREELQAEMQRYPEHFGIAGAFLDYWTEPDPSGKMRFQLEKAWETGRRLKRWAGNATRPWANAGTPPPVCDPFSKEDEKARRKELEAFE